MPVLMYVPSNERYGAIVNHVTFNYIKGPDASAKYQDRMTLCLATYFVFLWINKIDSREFCCNSMVKKILAWSFVRCDSSASCAQSWETNRHPLDRAFRSTSCTFTSGTKHSQLLFLLFCDKPLSIRIWIISITVWKRGHINKHLETRSRNYITVLFSGNERKARPSGIVIDHAP